MLVVRLEPDPEIEAAGPREALQGCQRGILAPALDPRDLGLCLPRAPREFPLRKPGAGTNFLDESPRDHAVMIAKTASGWIPTGAHEEWRSQAAEPKAALTLRPDQVLGDAALAQEPERCADTRAAASAAASM